MDRSSFASNSIAAAALFHEANRRCLGNNELTSRLLRNSRPQNNNEACGLAGLVVFDGQAAVRMLANRLNTVRRFSFGHRPAPIG
jgi:hypothetical protein